MPMYLVVHTPRDPESETAVFPPTKLEDLARDHAAEGSRTRWIKTFSPDLHDERHFSLWQARAAEDIIEVMERYHFMSEMEHHPIAVQEWDAGTVQEAG